MKTTKPRVKPVVSPPTQTIKLLQGDNELEDFKTRVLSFVTTNTIYSPNVRLVVWLLFHTGARVNEILSLKNVDVTKDWFIKIKSSKGSLSRVVSIPSPPFVYKVPRGTIFYLFPELSRFYIYRVCRDYNMYLQVSGNCKKSVTHSFRHYYASRVLVLQDVKNVAGRALGHKSNNSILHYDREKK